MSSVHTTISLTQGRKRLFDIAHEVQTPGVAYTLTSDGSPRVVLVSADEYESWSETLQVLSDFPTIRKDVREVRTVRASGAWKKWSTLTDLKRDWHIDTKVASKPQKRYGVRTRPQTLSKKSAR